MAANAALMTVMERTMEVAAELVTAMERGESLTEAMRARRASAFRVAATDAIRAFESSRHRARLRLIAVAAAEGATDADLCDLWSMSSEMVRRAKRELVDLEQAGPSESASPS
jgi:hypothetical protein